MIIGDKYHRFFMLLFDSLSIQEVVESGTDSAFCFKMDTFLWSDIRLIMGFMK